MMIEAFLWGGIAASSLLIGSLLALRLTIPERTVGLVMGFGAGVLLSAVAYDLVLEATLTETRHVVVFLGLLAGAFAFFLGNRYLERQRPRNGKAEGQTKSAAGMALILGAVLDGIPESIVLGLTLIDGEGIGLTVLLRSCCPIFRKGSPGHATSSSRAGPAPASRASGRLSSSPARSHPSPGMPCSERHPLMSIAFVQAFAGGAVIAMLTDSMIPEAYEKGGNLVGLVTALGFAMAFGLTLLEWIPGI